MPSPRSVIQSTTTEKSPRHLLRSLNLHGRLWPRTPSVAKKMRRGWPQ